MHLIGNMWFLWLAGFVLEDVWGRWLYSAFYLIAGAAALQFHAWSNAGSITPTLGASGAVAALMGAFLVRFPKMKIEMAWFLGFKLLPLQSRRLLAASAVAAHGNFLWLVRQHRRRSPLGPRRRLPVWSPRRVSHPIFRYRTKN